MKKILAVLAVMLLASAAWADLGLPNELVNPGFEGTSGWTVTGGGGMLNAHIPYSYLGPFGVPAAPGGGSYTAGVAGQNIGFPGGRISQTVDESQFAGWDPLGTAKVVEVTFKYFQYSIADVPMNTVIYLDYMLDGSVIDVLSPNYVLQEIGRVTNSNSGGWKDKAILVELPTQPRFLSLHFEFTYFTGTGINIIDNVNLQGQCIDPVPEPASLLALGAGLVGLVRFRRRK